MVETILYYFKLLFARASLKCSQGEFEGAWARNEENHKGIK